MELGRRKFVELTVVFSVGSLVAACSSDDEKKTQGPTGTDAGGTDAGSKPDSGADSGADAGDGGSTFACRDSISQNHGHKVTIPVADLSSTSPKTYSIKGTSPHNHDITLEAQDFADLKAGLSIMKSSTDADTHNHTVSILCASL
jgi:hypothetical protein